LRENKARVINIEHVNVKQFGVSANFVMPEKVLNILQKFGS
jgi:hypothetical protein